MARTNIVVPGKGPEIITGCEITLDDGSKIHVPIAVLADEDGKLPGEAGYKGVKTYQVDSEGNDVPVSGTRVEIIDGATITATVTGAEIDFSMYQNFVITYNLGAGAGGTPTLVLTLQVKDSNGNWITDADYTSAALAASSSGLIKGYFESFLAFRIVATLGGTGTLAASTISVELK